MSSLPLLTPLTLRAYALSEKYRVPVVLLMDEVIGHMREKIEAKIDDKSMLEVMDRDYREYLDDGWETHEDIRDKLIEKFTTGFYCGNKDKVTAYAEFLMNHYDSKRN